MKTYIADIIPKIQRFSRKLDDLTILTNQHWVSLDEIGISKRVYIFRTNNQLLISDNGIVEKGTWEYLGNQSLLLETKNENYLLKHAFFDENVIALKLDSTDSYAFFVNETKYHKELNTIKDIVRFLEIKYLENNFVPDLHGSQKTRSIEEEYSRIDYEIIEERKNFNFAWGSYSTLKIKFTNGIVGKVHKGKSSGKYFYYDNTGVTDCDNLENAIYTLYSRKRSEY